MHLEITPQSPIGEASFRLGKNFLGKDADRNCFVALLSERDRIFTIWLVRDGLAQAILSNADKRTATRTVIRKEASLQYRLTAEGARLFRQVYNVLGSFSFCFFEDEQLPTFSQNYVNIDDLVEGFILDIGQSISVIGRKS